MLLTRLKEIYKDICGYDHENTGLISENQLNLIVIKHELPLKVSTLRMLCHKFSGMNDWTIYFKVMH